MCGATRLRTKIEALFFLISYDFLELSVEMARSFPDPCCMSLEQSQPRNQIKHIKTAVRTLLNPSPYRVPNPVSPLFVSISFCSTPLTLAAEGPLCRCSTNSLIASSEPCASPTTLPSSAFSAKPVTASDFAFLAVKLR